MIFSHNRLSSSFCLGMVLLSLCFVSSCKPNPPDAREELVSSLKGADVKGYLFALKEEDNQITSSLTNGALRNPIKFDGNNSVVIGYARVKDKKTNATKTLKAEILKTDNNFTLQITDIEVGELPTKFTFPNPKVCDPAASFTRQECFDDFNCKIRPALLCEANRSCKTQFFDFECCPKDAPGFHALIIVKPTELRCLAAFPFDIDTLVVSP